MSGRRAVLKGLLAAPVLAAAARAEARDYTSAAEVLAEIDRLEADLDARLTLLAAEVPAAALLASSIRADHARHHQTRLSLRRRLRLPEAAESGRPAATEPRPPLSVDSLRARAEELVHAHAEGLPALGDASAVEALAQEMVDDARHLAILQMWSEADQDG